ncbi:MAG: transglutaminase domain-containing protein [Candidatus Woesearchaeota archaeon]|nr:MAG: transglutaminase domain-containing protein [Candidatus Woesearchaeota archaeon]
MRQEVVFAVLLLLSIASSVASPLYHDELTLSQDIVATYEVRSGAGEVRDLESTISWFPQNDDRQTVRNLSITPQTNADVAGLIAGTVEGVTFFETRPESGEHEIRISYTIETKQLTPQVTEVIPYPYPSLSPGLQAYLAPTDIIDLTPEIRQLASQILYDVDDYYEAIYLIGLWVEEHIDYSLSTTTIDASKQSSWVLENRQGVCDEITNLFISLLRSSGIPARFISGIAYTNSDQFAESWGGHGWAEVYVPNKGWVPFDITYKQYGYVDATHVKLEQGQDSNKFTTEYAWSARGGATVKSKGIATETRVVSQRNVTSEQPFSVTFTPYQTLIGFGSYNLLEAVVENDASYYQVIHLQLGQTTDMTILDELDKVILLKPGEKKVVNWRLKVSDDLLSNARYTFPSIVVANNEPYTTQFEVLETAPVLSSYEVELLQEDVGTESSPPEGESPLCTATETQVLTNSSIQLSCSTPYAQTTVCSQSQCYTFDDSFTFTIPISGVGVLSIPLSFTYTLDEVVKTTQIIVISAHDYPDLHIANISVPITLAYNDEGELSFKVAKRSATYPPLLTVEVISGLQSQKWEIDDMDRDILFTVPLLPNAFSSSMQEFVIVVVYEDVSGKTYRLEETVDVTLTDVPLTGRTMILLNKVASFFFTLF